MRGQNETRNERENEMTTTTTNVPRWVPVGPVRKCLEGHGNILAMLPNKDGQPTICTVDVIGGKVVFGQMNADGDGNAIIVPLVLSDVKQLDAKLS
jgi:hypothetical protein